MYRATTEPLHYVLPVDTSTCPVLLVVFKQADTKIKKKYANGALPSGMTLDGKNVIVTLTQEEANMFYAPFEAETQIRVKTNAGLVYASKVFPVPVERVLDDEVL